MYNNTSNGNKKHTSNYTIIKKQFKKNENNYVHYTVSTNASKNNYYYDSKDKTNKILNYSNCKIIFIILNNVYNNNNNRF
jgi:hypothetical protein